MAFFFLRIDTAGDVTKRFNATSFHLAQDGGACPRWDILVSFRTPGRIIPQFVEMPDGSRYFTINRTVDRPVLGRHSQDNRLAVTLGCSIEHASKIVYARPFQIGDPDLITVKGLRLIQACPVCLYAGSLVPESIVAAAPEGARVIDTAPMKLNQSIAEIEAAHERGQDGARGHSADPALYGATADQIRRLGALGIPFDTTHRVSGVRAGGGRRGARS